MALEVGSRIAHYDVTALIGEGGMGQFAPGVSGLRKQITVPETSDRGPENGPAYRSYQLATIGP